jgi:hypothetical protein
MGEVFTASVDAGSVRGSYAARISAVLADGAISAEIGGERF